MEADGLARNAANHVPLSPIGFLTRAATVHPDRTAVVHGERRWTWRETAERCRRLASALTREGVGQGEVVAMLAPNTPAAFEATFGVPMAGAVLCAMNTRLDADTIAYMLGHGEARVLMVDRELAALATAALTLLPGERRPRVIDIADPAVAQEPPQGTTEYETFLSGGDPAFAGLPVRDEWDAIALNYTSGTTGRPKGVLCHHRGAYLNALGNVLAWEMPRHPVYLWTLPLFHCNGWCFAWTVAALAGTSVCLRRVEPVAIEAAIEAEGVTHLCCAPVVMSGLLAHGLAGGRAAHVPPVAVATAGAAPPAAVIEGMERLGYSVTHVYGLTETYGPSVGCEWHAEWDALPASERAAIRARQGVPYVTQEALEVAGPDGAPVPADGATMGELLIRGNAVMKGYLKDRTATEAAFAGGWFHTGDLGVRHPDGYVEVRDRAKDIVISGGENISTIEVEGVLYRHPAVLEAAVVARPDPHWGETPCAFVTLRDGMQAGEAELIAFCRERMAHFKAPRTVVFGTLPKTGTGKMQKFLLRERARGL